MNTFNALMSLTLDGEKPFKRWQTTNPGIVKFIKVSPTRLQIIGTAVGESTLSIWDKTGDKQSFDLSVSEETRSNPKEEAGNTPKQSLQRTESLAQHKIPLRLEPTIPVILNYDIPLHKNQKIDLKKP